MTTLVVLQPGYLPWLGYFDLMHKADMFVHYDDVQFDKHGWRNRNRIKGPLGPVWLTVPVLHRDRSGQSLLEVEIDNRQDWRRKHLAAIRQYFARAPFADAVVPALSGILGTPLSRLIELDLAIIDWLARELGVSTPCHRSSQLGVAGDRNDRLLNLCRHFGAGSYLSGNAARSYLDIARFEAAGVEVVWHDYAHPAYPQPYGDFIPYMSVLDLLLNVGPRSLAVLSGTEQPSAAG